jgi:hypothetical protein
LGFFIALAISRLTPKWLYFSILLPFAQGFLPIMGFVISIRVGGVKLGSFLVGSCALLIILIVCRPLRHVKWSR